MTAAVLAAAVGGGYLISLFTRVFAGWLDERRTDWLAR